MAKEINKEIEIKDGADFLSLMAQIDKGDPHPAHLRALSKELDKKPQLYRSVGNAQKQVFSAVLYDAIPVASVREITNRYIEEMKSELGYQTSTFLEKMLIDEIVMRWLRLSVAERNHNNLNSQQRHAIEAGLYVEKQLDMAQKRFLKAVDALAKVRKMIAQTQAKGAEMFKNLINNG